MGAMKHSTLYMSVALAVLVPGCTVSVTPMAPAPPPAAIVVAAPEAYVWDGVEFVGEYKWSLYVHARARCLG